MRGFFDALGVTVMIVSLTALTFALYAGTAVVYGAPLIFVLWLFGAL